MTPETILFGSPGNPPDYFATVPFTVNTPRPAGVNVSSIGTETAPSQATVQRSFQAPEECGIWVTKIVVFAPSGQVQLAGCPHTIPMQHLAPPK